MPKRHIKGGMAAALVLLGLALLLNSGQSVTAHGDNDDHDHDENTPTYYRDIQPILTQHCMGCHATGGIGSVVFDTPQMAQFGAQSIADAVDTHFMPPWMPGPETPPLRGDFSLSQEQIQAIVAWAADGAPLGDRADTQPAPAPAPSVRADLVLEMPEYTPDETLYDDYRCFLLDADLPADRYITGYTVEPGSPSIVHHVLLFQVDESARRVAMNRSGADGRPGWTCFGGPGLSGAGLSDSNTVGGLTHGGGIAGSVGAWAPGVTSIFHPEGTGALLRADGLIIMQVHYNLENGVMPDQTRAVFQLAAEDEEIIALRAMNLVAPVEIPCPAGMDTLDCDRATAFSQALQEDGERARRRIDGLLMLCARTAADYAGQDAARVVSTCDFRVPRNLLAVGTAAHMHQIGREFIITRSPGTAQEQVLLHIPDWDFHWQNAYQYTDPIPLNAGEVIRVTCVWDNSQGSRYILWGEGTRDEMCLGALTVRPREGQGW